MTFVKAAAVDAVTAFDPGTFSFPTAELVADTAEFSVPGVRLLPVR